MLKAKIAELMNEPGCARNQAKSEGERKKGCGKSLVPGAAAGGCAFDGAKIALQPITDVVHLVHGPIACEGNSWDGRNSWSTGSDLYRRGFTTDLSNLDIIAGGEKKLYKAIRQAVARHAPPAVFVYQTCVGSLIGDDVDAVCRAATRRLGTPVIPINSPGFVGSKNLGNRLGGDALFEHVIGTVEPDDAGPCDINILGEYNVAGELDQFRPLLARLGIRLRASITGDARYREVAAAHTARANMVLCSQALVTLARKMKEKWGIPYFEGSFYGISDTSDALRNIARMLVERGADPMLAARAEALIAGEEARAWARIEPYKERLKGRKVLLYTGGVKSWSVIQALQEVGIEVVGSSVRKATEADRHKALERLGGDEDRLADAITPSDMYAMFKDGRADMMLSGGRSQFVALKARTPWIDINQERHHGYAAYDGMVALVREIDLSINSPIWAQVRAPAPWEDFVMALIVDHNKALSTSPLKVSAPLGAALAFMGMKGCLPMFHGSQGCTAFALVMMVRHFREAIPLQTTAMNEISTILGGMDQVEEGLLNIARRARPEIIGLISTALTETRGEDMAGDVRVIRARNRELADIAVVDVSAPDFSGSLETGWGKAVTAIVKALARPSGNQARLDRVNLLPGAHLTPGDVEALKDIVADFGLEAMVLPDLSDSLDGHVPDAYTPTTLGGTPIAGVREMGRARLTIAIGEHMRIAARAAEDITGVPSVVLDRVTGLEAVDRLMVCLSGVSGAPIPARQRRARSQLVDAMLDGHFYFGGRSIAIAAEPALLWSMGRLVTDMGAAVAAAVTTRPVPMLAELAAERVIVGDFEDLEDQILEAGGADLIIANSNGRQVAAHHGIPLFRAGFPVFDRLDAAHLTSAGYRGTRDLITQLGNILMERPGHAHQQSEHAHGHQSAAAG